jgi:hypothetical protein
MLTENFDQIPYYDKRRILNEEYNNDLDIFVHVSFITNEVINKIDNPLKKELKTFDNISKLLVEGYLVCTVNGFRLIDPSNLVLNIKNDKVIWEEWQWKDIVNIFNFNEIYYLSYDSSKYVSLVHQIIRKDFDIDDNIQLSNVINSMVNIVTDYEFDVSRVIKKENDIVHRLFKLNKINDRNR